MKNDRITYPDTLRVISFFFVVLIHVTSVGLHDYTLGTTTWIWSGIFNSISHWSVPVFFMVSGMFFLDPKKEFDIHRFYRKNVLRIIQGVVIFGFLYSILDQYIYGTLSLKSIVIAIYGIITNNTGYHLWFLYTLLILYIATPPLRVFTAHATKKQLDYTLLLWFILSIIIGQVNMLVKDFLGINDFLPYNAIIVTGYAGYYLLGYRLKAYPISDKSLHLCYAFSVIAIITMPLASVVFSIKQGTWISSFCSQLGIGQCIIATTLFACTPKAKSTSKKSCAIGPYVYGAYLIHVFFVSLLFRILRLKLDAFCPPLPIIGYSVLVYIVSLTVSRLLSMISITKKIM